MQSYAVLPCQEGHIGSPGLFQAGVQAGGVPDQAAGTFADQILDSLVLLVLKELDLDTGQIGRGLTSRVSESSKISEGDVSMLMKPEF